MVGPLAAPGPRGAVRVRRRGRRAPGRRRLRRTASGDDERRGAAAPGHGARRPQPARLDVDAAAQAEGGLRPGRAADGPPRAARRRRPERGLEGPGRADDASRSWTSCSRPSAAWTRSGRRAAAASPPAPFMQRMWPGVSDGLDMRRRRADLIEITSGLRFPEGPVAMADGSVVLVEIFGPRITRVAPDGTKTTRGRDPRRPERPGRRARTARCTSATTAAASRRSRSAGMLFPARSTPTATSAAGSSASTSRRGEVTDLYTECDGRPLRAPNDLVFDAPRRLLVHRPRHPPRAAPATGPASTTPAPTARRSRRSCSRSTRPTASASRPTAAPCTGPRPTPAGCSSGLIVGAGRAGAGRPVRPDRLPRPACPASSCSTRWPSTAPATSASATLGQRRDHGHLADGRGHRARADGRPTHHQHLLRRRATSRTAFITAVGHRQAAVDDRGRGPGLALAHPA